MSNRGGYPILYRAVMSMVPGVALNITEGARPIARRAGLKRGTGKVKTAVISDYVGEAEQPLARQWLVDLSGCTRARFYSNASVPVYLLRSDNLSSDALDPADYEPFMDITSTQFSSSSSEWADLWYFQRNAQRITVSTSASRPEMDTGSLGGPFTVLLQAV